MKRPPRRSSEIPSSELAKSHDALVDDLATTQSELATTQSELATTQGDLAKLRTEVAKLRELLDRVLPRGGRGGGGGSGSGGKRAEDERLREEAAQKRETLAARRKKRREQQRPVLRRRGKRSPRTIPIDETMTVAVPADHLPADARFKGYVRRTFQEIAFGRRNVMMRRAKYMSSSTGCIVAPIPDGWSGEFGPNVHVFIHTMYWDVNVSEEGIQRLLAGLGVKISDGAISEIIQRAAERHEPERQAMHQAGVESAPYVGMDGTTTSCDGEPMHCHVVSNEVVTSFTTMPTKERVTAIAALGGGAVEHVVSDAVVAALDVPARHADGLNALPRDTVLDANAFASLLEAHLPDLSVQNKRALAEATALEALRRKLALPTTMLADMASNYDKILPDRAICWPHPLRDVEELSPVIDCYKREVDTFLEKAFAYYARLKLYRGEPSSKAAKQLEREFDELFSAAPEYPPLAAIIASMRSRKRELLAVLRDARVPLSNNGSERDHRSRVRKRDVSFGPRSRRGLRAWDTMQSIVGTTRKLGVSFSAFIRDRHMRRGEVAPLDVLVRERALRIYGSR